jgi:DNA-directed RNA polymerase alpha subunit
MLAAAGIRSVEQLRRLRRGDLLKINGIGPKSVERLLQFGRPAPAPCRPLTFLEKVPQARVWIEAGITAGCARRLVAAGITSIARLEKVTRDDLLAIRGVSEATIAKCEKVLGRPLAESAASWMRARGLPAYAANALQRAGVRTLEKLAGMTREELLNLDGIGETGLAACERLLGHPLRSDPKGR